MLETLPLKEKTAIELKYLGNTHKEISEKIDIPFDTVNGWFEKNGKLFKDYTDYVKGMNEKRQIEIETKYIESDENILRITTNIMRKVGANVSEKGGDLDVADFEKAWKIQRIMRGLPTNYEKRDIDATIETADEAIKALGLTDKDFYAENFESTIKRIAEYYQGNRGIQEGKSEDVGK